LLRYSWLPRTPPNGFQPFKRTSIFRAQANQLEHDSYGNNIIFTVGACALRLQGCALLCNMDSLNTRILKLCYWWWVIYDGKQSRHNSAFNQHEMPFQKTVYKEECIVVYLSLCCLCCSGVSLNGNVLLLFLYTVKQHIGAGGMYEETWLGVFWGLCRVVYVGVGVGCGCFLAMCLDFSRTGL